MNLRDLSRALAPIRQRILNVATRAIVKLVDDSKKFQTMQAELLDDEVRAGLEHWQSYGFTAVPLKGAEGLAISLGGRRDHTVIIACDDRRYRLKGLEGGEVAMYTDQGDKLVFKRDGNLEITASTKVLITAPLVEASQDFKISGNLEVVGNHQITGDLAVTGDVTAAEVTGGGKVLSTHTHGFDDADTASGGSGGSKETDAPT